MRVKRTVHFLVGGLARAVFRGINQQYIHPQVSLTRTGYSGLLTSFFREEYDA
jgi:hypothetical protein